MAVNEKASALFPSENSFGLVESASGSTMEIPSCVMVRDYLAIRIAVGLQGKPVQR